MHPLSTLRGRPWLVWGCKETVRRCSRWLPTGPPMAHLGREDGIGLNIRNANTSAGRPFLFPIKASYLFGTITTNK